MTATPFKAALRIKFVIWMVVFALLSGAVVTTAQPAAPNPTPAKTDATRNDLPGWAPWTANSIQPPPAIQPAKLPPLTPQPGDGETEVIVRQAIAWFEQAVQEAGALVAPAEAAASAILAGGRMYGCGSPGLIQEFYGRAGGFSFFDAFSGDKIARLNKNDLLLIGQLTPKDECLSDHDFVALTSGGGWNCPATVVHLASHN